MSDTYYTYAINEITRITVFFETEKNNLKKFVVKLEYYYNARWYEVTRYDTYHKYVHRDDLNISGDKIRTIKYILMDYKSGLNMAISQLKEDYLSYIWRFRNEKANK